MPKKSPISALRLILRPDRAFFYLALVYGLGIGLLTLALPISVQALLNTVVNTALPHFILLLAAMLLGLLLISITLIACRDYAMELFQRRFIARIAAEATLRLTHADQMHMESINRAELVNRFFEIMHVQKNVPALLTEGFFIALQGVIGLVVVSFYHPFLFVYNMLFTFCLYLIWQIWAKRALVQAQHLSDSKYELVQWIEEMARVNLAFKSTPAIQYALSETDAQTDNYMQHKKAFFRTTFAQSLGFLLLYAVASAGLLGLGGVLVARNQLSLGQLVGAELIMSAVFYGLSKFGYYARIYYELVASLNKLGYFFDLPLEKAGGRLNLTTETQNTPADLVFENVSLTYRCHPFAFDCVLPANGKILAKSVASTGSKLFLDLLKSYRPPEQGRILLAAQDLHDYDTHQLRADILAVDNFTIIEGTIKRCFDLYSPHATNAQIMDVLTMVELDAVINALPDGLETALAPSGYPLLQEEVIRLKLAAMLLAKPKILVLAEIYDAVPFQRRKRILQRICALPHMMLICFTNRKEWQFFDQYLFIDERGTHSFDSLTVFQEYEHGYITEVQS